MNATLLMVLILSLGAWRAWSRSPLFSAKVVIEIVAAVGVVVATMLGALLWIMNHGKSLAPQAAFTLALGLIFAATGLLVVIIILISDGPVPVPARRGGRGRADCRVMRSRASDGEVTPR